MNVRPLHDVMAIEGLCEPQYARVRDVFEQNFAERGEVGAAVCLYADGRPVVDLWGGLADRDSQRPWRRDTLVCVMSLGKSVCAIALLMLVDRGLIDLDEPVARYWPGFGQAGKANITVRTLLSAKAAILYADAAPDGGAYDWQAMIRALEVQAPEWEPGTRGAYHSMTFGLLIGELVRRTDGRRIETFVTEEIERPLGIDFKFGLDADAAARTATIIPNEGNVTLRESGDRTTKLGRAWRVQPRPVDAHYRNTDMFRRAVFPSSNGHSNARSVARLYALMAAGGALDGVRLLSSELVEAARTETWNDVCGLTDRPFRYGLGHLLNQQMTAPFGSNPRAYGHTGAGGAVGIIDPEQGLAFAYTPNAMCAGIGIGERAAAVVAAALE